MDIESYRGPCCPQGLFIVPVEQIALQPPVTKTFSNNHRTTTYSTENQNKWNRWTDHSLVRLVAFLPSIPKHLHLFLSAAPTPRQHSLRHLSTAFLTCLFRPGSGDTSWKTATRPDAVPTATRSSKQLSNFTAVIASLLPWKDAQMDTDVRLDYGF